MDKYRGLFGPTIIAFLLLNPLFAREPLLVISERIPIEAQYVSGSVSTLSRGDLDNSKSSHTFQALSGLAGVSISNSGGPGGTTSAFIRGNDSGHTLVLIDGIEMN
ncbi:MAG: TonB-dependent receptor plug domain-containing protein, partial [Halobacteriovoraceae bacterium]|nr:TonB-dependent receptor plug domain-containing protein [Halobacteriovoraceae bacterium]